MKRLLLLLCLLLVAWQSGDPVPTLIPPTRVPMPDGNLDDALLSESAVARIQREGTLRVGIRYNAPPFGLLNIRGEVAGFDADLARSMAAAWGVDIEFVQVTGQTALDMLMSQRVDFLAAAQVHRRESELAIEFSQTYYRGSQAVMVRQDDGATVIGHMADRTLGVVIGTPSAATLARSGLNATVQTYLTLDQGLVALVNGDIDGLVSSRIQLRRLLQPGLVRILDDALEAEPYAIGLRRQDASLRNLINRTLQHLVTTGRIAEIYDSNFPGSSYPDGLVKLWRGLGDAAPRPDEFATNIAYPGGTVVARLQGGQSLRVAGLQTVTNDAPESEQRLAALNKAIAERLVARWGVSLEFVPNSAENALDLVASGQADLAVGVSPDWAWTDRVDFTSPYLLHGDRLLVKHNSDIDSFNELRGGRWVGVFGSESGSADRVNALADSIGSAVNIYTMIREPDVPFYILEDQNADVAYGDSLKLMAHVQRYPDDFRLTIRCQGCDPWYSREYVGLAVARNDLDFRLLVEYTLQELALDGTLALLLQPVMLPEEIPEFEIWPGPATYLEFSLQAG